MCPFRNTSILWKQTRVTMLTNGVALLLTCLAFTGYEVVSFRHSMVANSATLADLIGNNTAAALDSGDRAGIEKSLSGLRADAHIVAAAVYSKDGAVIAKYTRPGESIVVKPPTLGQPGYTFARNGLCLFRPIMSKEKVAGTVFIQSDVQALCARLQQYLLVVLAVLCTAAVVAFVLSIRLERVICGPIFHLMQIARQVADEQNYSVRATKQSEDELGVLVDKFNAVLDQIQRREVEVLNAKKALERRADERTAELAVTNAVLRKENFERKQAEESVRRTEEVYRRAISGAEAVPYAYDYRSRTYSFMGEGIEQLIGYRAEEVSPALWLQIIQETIMLGESAGLEKEEAARRVVDGEIRNWHCDMRVRTRDGQIRWLSDASVQTMDGSGHPTGSIGILQDITERKEAEAALCQRSRLAALGAAVGVALTREETLSAMLNRCAEAMVGHLDAAFARIWTLNPRENVLELQASAGMYTHVSGPHSRVPVGKFKIGLIAQERKAHLTNSVVGDPRVGDQEWAQREGMVAFAGYPLIVDEQVVGVMAMFARHMLSEETLQGLGSIADGIALGIIRKQNQDALRAQEERTRLIIDQAFEAVITADINYGVIGWNRQAEKMLGWTEQEMLGVSLIERVVPPARRAQRRADLEQFRASGQWSDLNRLIETTALHRDGREVPVEITITPIRLGSAQVFTIFQRDITERKKAEAKLQEAQKQLLAISRQAGMAEVATGVLHNVGNVLNSVNVTATLVEEQIRKSQSTDVERVARLLTEHATELGTYLTQDPKGSLIPEFLTHLSRQLAKEREALLSDLAGLRKNVEHIKEIVATQQSYAKVSGVIEQVNVADLVEDTLRMHAGALVRHNIRMVREYTPLPPIATDKHKVLQILLNLVSNAKYACAASGLTERQITLRVTNGEERVRISVIDNGVGIAPENLTRIFNHGFTTRKDGHGFGLHSGALAARELGGTLTLHSDGLGKGAMFTLELPAPKAGADAAPNPMGTVS